jgi:hypothetical protein
LGIIILNIFITVRLLMTINVLFLGVAYTRSLLHHDHLLGFSASLLYYALYVGGSISATSRHLLYIVADCVEGSLRASLRHDWR